MLKRTGAVLLVSVGLIILIAWAFLQSAIFSSVRSTAFEKVLSDQIGREILLDGEVRIVPGVQITFDVSDVTIPSEHLPEVALAQLDRLSLQTDTMDLLRGRVDFHSLDVSGLTVHLTKTSEGLNSWSVNPEPKSGVSSSDPDADEMPSVNTLDQMFRAKGLLDYLVLRSDALKTIRVMVDNQQSGFNFDFRLGEMIVDRSEAEKTLRLHSAGTVNDVPFKMDGNYALEGPFRTYVTFSDIVANFEGESFVGDDGRGYTGQLDISTDDIGGVLDILKLDRTTEGAGQLTARLENDGLATNVSAFSSTIDFSAGPRFSASGTTNDIETLSGSNLDLKVEFFPAGPPPPQAYRLSDLLLTEVSARLAGKRGAFKVEDAVVRTNAFEQDIGEFGPISIGQIQRTEEGKLELSDVVLLTGPADDPYLRMQGVLKDALEFKGLDFKGQVLAPASRLFPDLDEKVADQFGEINASFALSDRAGFPQLTQMDIASANTDLWRLKASSQTGSDDNPLSVALDVDLEISDTARFLRAVDLKEVDVSPLGASLRFKGDSEQGDIDLDFQAGTTKISSQLSIASDNRQNALNGRVTSDDVVLADLGKWVAGIRELRELNLVLQGDVQDVPTADENVPVQPLVLDEHEIILADILAQDGVEPLVLEDKEPTIAELLDPDSILLDTTIDVQIDFKKITGAKGITRLTSALTAKGGKARFGPLDLSYGGGFAKLTADMDVIKAPNMVSVSGTTGGWDFGQILQATGVDIGAAGTLNGSFDLRGRHQSLRDFVQSMSGSVRVDMADGYVATSMLELAGLGVLPWLFSKERRDKQTPISCLSAPLKITAGRVSFDQVVAETPKVQMTAKGALDWRKDSISVRAEARPLGKPLARSAWPVDVTGRLSDAQIKPQVGGSRSRRADGATKMPANRKRCVPDIFQLVVE